MEFVHFTDRGTGGMSPISLQSVVTVSSQQVSCDVAGEAVILNLNNGQYYGLDPVGARIWELIQEQRSVRELRDMLIAEYVGVEPEQCAREVMALLEQMADSDLIDVVDDV